MIDRDHALPLSRQANVLNLSRGSLYYTPVKTSDADLELMREMDMLHTDRPFAGAWMLRGLLRRKGFQIGRRHVARLMRLMGIEALYRKKKGTKTNPAHPIHPYLLRNLVIDRPNQVWCADISYIPMRRGFLYLFAILDWKTRRVLAWRLSNSLTTDFCIDAVEAAIAMSGKPEIFNTDQGCQFTALARALSGIEIVVLKPVHDRLPRDLELAGNLAYIAPGPDLLQDSTPELRREGGSLCHVGLLRCKNESVHGTGSTPVGRSDFESNGGIR
jgi:putative transposase